MVQFENAFPADVHVIGVGKYLSQFVNVELGARQLFTQADQLFDLTYLRFAFRE